MSHSRLDLTAMCIEIKSYVSPVSRQIFACNQVGLISMASDPVDGYEGKVGYFVFALRI